MPKTPRRISAAALVLLLGAAIAPPLAAEPLQLSQQLVLADPPLTNGQAYYVVVQAIDLSGNVSPNSVEIAQIPNQTSDFVAPTSGCRSNPSTISIATFCRYSWARCTGLRVWKAHTVFHPSSSNFLRVSSGVRRYDWKLS